MTATVTHLPGVAFRPSFDDVGAEIRQLRAEARARVSEVDLLVAALQDHIKDLRAERDWLRGELEQSRARHELAEAAWLHRGLKGSH